MTTLRDGFNALEASEAVAALLLTYYLERSAKTLYASQRSSGLRSEAGALAGTWPYLIHELIKRYLTDDVLQADYEQVKDARQKSNEDENEFADRIAKQRANAATYFGTGSSSTILSVVCSQRQGTQSLRGFDTSPLTNRETLR